MIQEGGVVHTLRAERRWRHIVAFQEPLDVRQKSAVIRYVDHLFYLIDNAAGVNPLSCVLTIFFMPTMIAGAKRFMEEPAADR